MKLADLEEAVALSKEYRVVWHFLDNFISEITIRACYDTCNIKTMLSDEELAELDGSLDFVFLADETGFGTLATYLECVLKERLAQIEIRLTALGVELPCQGSNEPSLS